MTSDSSLLNHLASHSPLDAAEAAYHRQIVDLVRAAGLHGPRSAWSRSRFDPGHLTGSAFLVVRQPRPTLLLIHHPTLARWLQPGGHVEIEDDLAAHGSLAATAARELREETGIVLPPTSFRLIDLDVHAIPANPRKGEPAHLHLDCRYVAVTDIPPSPLHPPVDPCESRWWPLDEAARLEAGIQRLATKLSGTL